MEVMKTLTLTILCTKFGWKRLSFHYAVIFTGLSTIKAIYSSSRPEMLLNIFKNQEENTCFRVSFFIKLQT